MISNIIVQTHTEPFTAGAELRGALTGSRFSGRGGIAFTWLPLAPPLCREGPFISFDCASRRRQLGAGWLAGWLRAAEGLENGGCAACEKRRSSQSFWRRHTDNLFSLSLSCISQTGKRASSKTSSLATGGSGSEFWSTSQGSRSSFSSSRRRLAIKVRRPTARDSAQ